MDIIELLEMFLFPSSVVIYNSINTIISRKIKLNKLSQYNNHIIEECSNFNIRHPKVIEHEINNENISQLLPLIEKLIKYTKEDNLNTMYYNINFTKVKKQSILSILRGFIGQYNIKKNTIKYFMKKTLEHEFLHMASSTYDIKNDKRYSGFTIYINKEIGRIGIGLTEGYTELLASRIYYKDKVLTYKKEVRIAEIFEFFFDNAKNMEKYYFNYDLPGFIHHMENYTSKEEIIKLIIEIDNLSQFDSLSPVLTYYYIKIQLTLYNWFKEKSNNPDKLAKLEELLCKNKLVSIIINNEKITLCRTSPYDNHHNKQKIK